MTAGDALRLHRWLALHDPMGAFLIAEEAGARTADYIIIGTVQGDGVIAGAAIDVHISIGTGDGVVAGAGV